MKHLTYFIFLSVFNFSALSQEQNHSDLIKILEITQESLSNYEESFVNGSVDKEVKDYQCEQTEDVVDLFRKEIPYNLLYTFDADETENLDLFFNFLIRHCNESNKVNITDDSFSSTYRKQLSSLSEIASCVVKGCGN